MQKIAIETCGLTRRFGAQLAVNEVNLLVPEARVYGFLGPNGAGKTTTIRMLLGLIRSLLRRVGALVETPSLYSHLTGRENLEVTRRLIGAERKLIDRALDIVKLTADAHRRVREYSLGMRQRLSLALALLNNPDLLILDEPANGLDPAGIHEMRDLIRRLATEFGITIFLSSHLLSEVEQVASHIGIIHQGKLVFQGTLAELQAERHQHLAIGVNQPDQATSCLTAAGWSVQRNGDGLLTVAATSRDAAVRVNSLLVSQSIEVFHIALAQASLEDIFLNITNNKIAEMEVA